MRGYLIRQTGVCKSMGGFVIERKPEAAVEASVIGTLS
jgi:hypothetical protein